MLSASSSTTMCEMYHNTDNWQKFRGGYLKPGRGGFQNQACLISYGPRGGFLKTEFLLVKTGLLKMFHRKCFYL